eukprot:6442012-Amphidinium_carterae.9
MRNGLHLTNDGYRGYLGNNQTEVKLHYIVSLATTYTSRLQCSTGYTTTLTKPKTVRVGTPTGMMTSSRRTWSMDYIKKTYNKFQPTETTYLEISHNKKRAHHVHSKHQLPQLEKQSMNTISLTCHIGTERWTTQTEHQCCITQIDSAFLKSDNDRHNATIIVQCLVCAAMCESTTGRGHATMVPYIQGNESRSSQSDNQVHCGKRTTKDYPTM